MLRDLSNLVRRPRVPMRGVLRQGGRVAFLLPTFDLLAL
jgi:hypothetical protein